MLAGAYSMAPHADEPVIVVGGSGFVGTAVCAAARELGRQVTVIDRLRPRYVDDKVRWQATDLLVDDVHLPEGAIVVAIGGGHPRPRWPWTVALETCLCTARLLPKLHGRRVTLVSSVEVYGCSPGVLNEDREPSLPLPLRALEEWCREAQQLTRESCPPWRAAPLCRKLAESDRTGRWIYGLAKRAQELLVANPELDCDLTVLRVANLFGVGQERVISRLVRRALSDLPLVVSEAVRSFVPVEELARLVLTKLPRDVYNVGGDPIALSDLADLVRSTCESASSVVVVSSNGSDSSGLVDVSRLRAEGFELPSLSDSLNEFVEALRTRRPPLFVPALPVVVPPRPVFPELVAARQQESLWNGALKSGNRWSTELSIRLAETLQLPDSHDLLVTSSGTEALRLAIAAAAPRPLAGHVAVVPSFTFPATTDVLKQLGYALHYVDVDSATWTIDPEAVAHAVALPSTRLVVCVDTFGNPCDYSSLTRICSDAGVPLVADSAASLGSLYRGAPVTAWADAHAYSMSFAKVLSAGGSGGAVVLPADRVRSLRDWTRSSLIGELHAIPALDQLAILPDLVKRRAAVASVYADAARNLTGVTTQRVRPPDRHSYVHWVMQVTSRERRAKLQRDLALLGVETKRYFRALHLADGNAGLRGSLPTTEELHDGVLALPMSSELTVEDAESVVAALVECSLESKEATLASRF
jgi:dTDP-4-amino-4,6-dideoxygalactose transaminase/nucleoside-diphosphate-sugar epimerase